MMIRIFLIGFLWLAEMGVWAQNRKWTLEECIDYGVEQSLEMQRQRLNNRNEQLDVRDTWLNLFPAVNSISPNAAFNYGRGIDPETNTYTHVQNRTVGGFSIGGGMKLFAGFSAVNRLRAARISRLKGQEETENLANDLAIRIMEAFFNLVYTGESVRIMEEQLENSTLQVKKVQREYELGRLPRSDLFDMQARQAQDEYRLISSRNECSNALITLKHLMNYHEKSELEIDAAAFVHVVAISDSVRMEEVYSQALKQLPEMLAAEYDIRISRLNWQIVKAGLYPSLSINGGVTFGYYSSQADEGFWKQVTDKNRIGKNFGFSLNIPVFNGLSKRSSVSLAKNNYRDARFRYQQTEQHVYIEIQKALLDLESAVQQYEVACKTEDYSELAYQAGKKRYEQGLITVIELNTTASNLLQARYDLLRAQLGCVMQKRMVDFYKGIPLQTRVQ